MNYRKLLKNREYAVGVWGTGYIGFSTMAFFAKAGVRTTGYDISEERVKKINSGGYFSKEMKKWIGFPVKPLVERKLLSATTRDSDFIAKNVLVHFIAIPTEKNGKPYFTILKEVIRKISKLVKGRHYRLKPLVIIESTLSPRTSDNLVIPLLKKYGLRVGIDALYGVAPRRDWFVENSKNLRKLDRVFGGYDAESSKAAEEVLGIVCKKLHRATSCYVSEMVKSFENTYRHVEITLANQISLAYPSQNIKEALELAGTKWNIGTFRPGFGTGGYCIPVASKYVLEGAEAPKELNILKESIKTDNKINILIARSICKRGLKKVGVLGLSYKGNMKVSVLSPTIPFVAELVKNGVMTKMYDPFFSKHEIKEILNIPTFCFPEDMNRFDGVVLIVDHKEYMLPRKRLLANLRNCRYILDNIGSWAGYKDDFKKMGVEYRLAGDANWL